MPKAHIFCFKLFYSFLRYSRRLLYLKIISAKRIVDAAPNQVAIVLEFRSPVKHWNIPEIISITATNFEALP